MTNIKFIDKSGALHCQANDAKAKITDHFFEKQIINNASAGMYERLTSAISSRKAFIVLNDSELEYKVSPDEAKPFEGLVDALIKKLCSEGSLENGKLEILLNDNNEDIEHEDKMMNFYNFNIVYKDNASNDEFTLDFDDEEDGEELAPLLMGEYTVKLKDSKSFEISFTDKESFENTLDVLKSDPETQESFISFFKDEEGLDIVFTEGDTITIEADFDTQTLKLSWTDSHF